MAEEVQAALDRMVPALNDLQERGVFTQEEIHAIVDRRRLSEYALRRRNPRKADYLRYLQQEMDLEKLRKLRVKRMRRKEREEKKPSLEDQDHERSKHIGDQHIIGLLHVLWKRTVRKFKSDLSLYMQYAAFCKEIHAQRALSSVYGEALRLHPNQVDLWIEAASHEFFQAGSIQNARVLMQQALRIHPKAENLWLQLFALELHFCTKMMGRRKIFRGNDDDEIEEHDEGHDPFAIATLVFHNASTKIPKDVRFRVRFWDQCRKFPRTEPLKRMVWESIMTECGDSPEAWLAWAIFAWELEKESKAKQDSTKKGDREDEGSDEEENDKGEGFLRLASNDEANSEPSQKKHRVEDGEVTEDDFGKESVLSVLGKAVQKIRTEEMFLKATRTVNSYIDDLNSEHADNSEIETAVKFLGDILSEASSESFYSANLAIEYATFLTRCGQKDDARKCLRDFIRRDDSDDQAHLWVQLAELSTGDATDILNEASKRVKVDKKEHFLILLRLIGAKMQAEEEAGLIPLFERILLLAPGFKHSLTLEQESFGVTGLADVCVQLLNFTRERRGTEASRKVYKAVLYKSTVAKALLESDEETTLMMFSAAIDVERLAQNDNKRKSDLRRLYDTIIAVLGESPLADDYRQQKREDLASYSTPMKLSIPKLNAQSQNFSASTLTEAFEKFRVVHLSNVKKVEQHRTLVWTGLQELFSNLNPADKESWCVETDQGTDKSELAPEKFLVPMRTHHRAYCSFLVQKDLEAYKETESSLPVIKLPKVEWSYETALWMFVGRNPPGSRDLPGRPEHTDSISADGTWHFQLSGTKKWIIRPTKELLRHMSATLKPTDFRNWRANSTVEINCGQGDVLIINTRLWFHQTRIPPQPHPSVSYARDFWRQPSASVSGSMSNVDGLYATNDIEEGVVIFTQETLPDCSLHRSDNPNCEIVETDDGQLAIVSARDIKSGEFFCVANSDDEGSTVEEEEEAEVDGQDNN